MHIQTLLFHVHSMQSVSKGETPQNKKRKKMFMFSHLKEKDSIRASKYTEITSV